MGRGALVSQGTCSVDECEMSTRARGMCNTHYQRWWKSGSTEAREKRICSIDGCGRPHRARGWCDAHWQRWSNTGDPGPAGINETSYGCVVERCRREHKSHGYCKLHYQRWLRTGSVDPRPAKKRQRCSVEQCKRVAVARGWCDAHWQRWQKTGDPGSAPVRARGGLCKVDKCVRRNYGQGYCQYHWRRWKRYGRPGPAIPDVPEVCSFSGCERSHSAKGLCSSHYSQSRRGRRLTPIDDDYVFTLERDADGNKRCTSCKRWLPEGDFGIENRAADSLTTQCATCRRSRAVRKRYGISAARYAELLARQDGVCAICGGVNKDGYALSVDHDHSCCPGERSCGECVRGLLCTNCNLGIGYLKENVARLASAIRYLGGS